MNIKEDEMPDNMTLSEFLKFISACSGDEAIEIISNFQNGGLLIENIGAEDFD